MKYVQYGCGFSVAKSWISYDNSPTLRIARWPGGQQLINLVKGARFPDEVRYGDIVRQPLAAPGSCAGVYASHVLEHLSLDDLGAALRHTFAMLGENGIFRLVVPDLECRMRRYVQSMDAGSDCAGTVFMDSTHLGVRQRPSKPMARLRQQFGNSQHLWMWDEPSLTRKLVEAGFGHIRRCALNDSQDAAFLEVEDPARFVDQSSGLQELAMECRRPG